MEDPPSGGRVGCSGGIGRAVKGSGDSRSSAPHLRQRRFPELLLAPHCLQHIAMEIRRRLVSILGVSFPLRRQNWSGAEAEKADRKVRNSGSGVGSLEML